MPQAPLTVKNPLNLLRRVKKQFKDGIEEMIDILSSPPLASEIINQKEIRVLGLKRTGNHAIINWIKKQQTGKVRYLNNIPCDKNPYLHFYERHCEYNKYPKAIRNFQRHSQGKFKKLDWLIYSYEDYGLEQIINSQVENNHDLYFGKSRQQYDVLILRDPFNLLASRLKSDFLEIQDPKQSLTDIWIAYAREYLGETQHLKNSKICINYNRWTQDFDYRQQISSQLGLTFSDAGINEVRHYGGGSSFEGRQFDGQATNMDVHNRWKHFMDHPLYRQLLDNPQLLEYSEQIFGRLPGTESLEWLR